MPEMMLPFTVDQLKRFVENIMVKRDQIEQLEEEIEMIAAPLQHAAHDLLAAREQYIRAGQSPKFARGVDGGVEFDVSNGRDPEDDFTIALSFDELTRRPEDEATRIEVERLRREIDDANAQMSRARLTVKAAQEALRELGVGLDGQDMTG